MSATRGGGLQRPTGWCGKVPGMAALRDALDKPAAAGPDSPPNLRAASRPARSCGSCTYYKPMGLTEGACRRYAGARVKSGQVCDAWKAP